MAPVLSTPPATRISTPLAWLLAALGVGGFHFAYEWDAGAGTIAVYLVCLYRLAWVRSARWAFYLGLGIGVAIAAPQLWFFVGIFGPAAIGLWLILGLWTALYLLLAHVAVTRSPERGYWLLPWLWFALEYFRSELYYLRFAWLIPGFALSHREWMPLAGAGVYGFSLLVLLLIAGCHALMMEKRFTRVKGLLVVNVLVIAVALLLSDFHIGIHENPSDPSRPFVVGIQLESPPESAVIEKLNAAVNTHPQVDLVVLSEYTFDGSVPKSILQWCRANGKHVIVGGKEVFENGSQFYDTAFVVGPSGDIVFRQGKAIPIQFMNDGLPAPSQQVWQSPWGNVGIAICYDLSYSRVIDRLVAAGAQALIIPAMDAEDWGAHEHVLHAKIVPVRAREYGIPILRVASSGVSQLVDSDGTVIASAPFPGQGEQVAGTLAFSSKGRAPADRYLALPAFVAVGLGLVCVAVRRQQDRVEASGQVSN